MDAAPTFPRASASDIPRLRELAAVIWNAAYASILPPGQIDYMLARNFSAERIAAEIAAGVAWERVVEDGRDAGFLAWEFFPERRLGRLHKLYLLPERQGRGLGQRCLAHVGADARAAGATVLELGVNKANARALKAYRRAGFAIVESVCTDIGGGFAMDDYILRRVL